MKYLFSAFLISAAFTGFGQSSDFNKNTPKDFCYRLPGQKAPTKGRYAEWECGKIAGIVDCNEKLELSQDQSTVVTSSNKKPFSGQCETCHQNGVLERRVTFINGKTEGVDTSTYESGCISVIRSHVNGVENGKWLFYEDSTFNPTWEKNYSIGELHGPQITWARKKDASGKYVYDTVKFETYTNGVLNGNKVSYINGKRTKVVSYKNGLMDGPFTVFNKDGVAIEELTFKEGKKNGVFKYYYDDGTLLKTENWDMGSKNGEFKTVYYNQTLQSVEYYKKGNGKVQQYLTAKTYECATEKTAYEIGKMCSEKKSKAEILETIGSKEVVNYYEDNEVLPEEKKYLDNGKIGKGLNKPFKMNGKFYVVELVAVNSVAKNEIREGWFEERFPDQAVKRRALYKKDVLIEEHVYDEEGREISSFGGTTNSGSEDDAMPNSKKDKKKKKKKNKKSEEENKPSEMKVN